MSEKELIRRMDHIEQTVLKLSDDIGAMANRILDMADKIGEMSDRILETQKIQGKNIELTQQSILETVKMIGEQFQANNKIMELILTKDLSNISGLTKK